MFCIIHGGSGGASYLRKQFGERFVVEVAGKLLYLTSNTSLELVKNAKTAEVFVEHGEVRIESVAANGSLSFVLQTPHAEIRDGGGTAEIAVSGKSTRVALNDGNLQITRRFDRTHLDLEAGAWVSTGSDQEPMKPERSSVQAPVVLFNVRAEQVALSPDGKTMALFTGKSVEIWDVASRNRTLILDPARKRISGLTFSPDGDWLVLGDRQPFLQVWDWRQCKLLRNLEPLDGEEEAVWPAFSGDGTKLYCLAHRPWSVVGMRGWKVADWSVAPSLTRDKNVKYLLPIVSAPSVLGGMRDGSLLVWNAAEDRQERMIHFGKKSWKPVAVSRNAELVAFGSEEGTTLWDLRQEKALWHFEGQGCCAFSPDDKMLVVGSFGFLDFLEVATGQRIATYRTEGDRARWLGFSNGGQELNVLSGPKHRVHSWKVPALPSY